MPAMETDERRQAQVDDGARIVPSTEWHEHEIFGHLKRRRVLTALTKNSGSA